MKHTSFDVYDVILLVDISKDGTKSIRKLSKSNKIPFQKTQIGERLAYLEREGLITTHGATKGAKRELTKKGKQWMKEQGYLK